MVHKNYQYFLGAALLAALAWGIKSVLLRPRPSVILLSAARLAYHEEVAAAFVSCMQNAKRVAALESIAVPDIGNKSECTALCDTVLEKKACCIVVIGRTLAQILTHQARKREVNTPIIFVGAQDPVELGLVKSMEHPGGLVTGVLVSPLDNAILPRLVAAVRPTAKRVLIPFYALDASGEARKKVAALQEGLESCFINAYPLPIDSLPDALMRIVGACGKCDVIVTVEGDAVNDGSMTAIAQFAKKQSIPYFSSLMTATYEGVPFVFACKLSYLAEAAFELVKKIVFDGLSPCNIPVVELSSSREFIINKARAAELGITVSEQVINAAIEADSNLAAVHGRVRII